MTVLISCKVPGMVGEAYDYIKTEDQVPALYSQELKGADDAIVYVKLFSGSWTWYITEFDPESGIAFGLVDGHEQELGYMSIPELAETPMPPFGLGVERDLYWTPKPLRECYR